MSEYIHNIIAAVATPPGRGGIAVVRVSGDGAADCAQRVFRSRRGRKLSDMAGYTACLGDVVSGERVLDEAVVLVFRAPHSYTGEDVVEIMCHGGEQVAAAVLRAVLDAGAVPASAGEFTRRALLNGRVSLTEAEAIADIIGAAGASGEAAAQSAARGRLWQEATRLKDELLALSGHIAASLDYPEEDVEPLAAAQLDAGLQQISAALGRLLDGYAATMAALRGVPTVIAGSPNVGKSTLLNLLAGCECALVTPVAGTTRDVVQRAVRLGGTTLILSDTAGLRETDDAVEKLGVALARRSLAEAQLVLAVFDSSAVLTEEDRQFIDSLRGRRAVAVINKTDLERRLDSEYIEKHFETVVSISALDSDSAAVLDAAISRALGTDALDPDAAMLANERQHSAAAAAAAAVERALTLLRDGMTPDVVGMEIDAALDAVMQLSGERVSDAVVDEVFSKFCVGK